MKRTFLHGNPRGIQPKHINRILNILDLLDAADNIQVMNFPGSGLQKLEPKGENIWIVKVSDNWRIIFKFITGDAYMVDYIDYH
ncbi:MAG: type II toxin-antitoxin system RelE/ParE family toxin [Calditrichia bacterium]